MVSYLESILSAAFVALALPAQAAAGEPAQSPIYGVTVPDGYRQWEVIAPSREAGLDELRVIVGNRAAVATYAKGAAPFPDGTTLVKLAWKEVASPDADGAFVPGAATTVQVMVKDSRRYAATGGWGFGRFVGGKPVDAAQHRTCFACHAARVADRDFVFTRFAR